MTALFIYTSVEMKDVFHLCLNFEFQYYFMQRSFKIFYYYYFLGLAGNWIRLHVISMSYQRHIIPSQ